MEVAEFELWHIPFCQTHVCEVGGQDDDTIQDDNDPVSDLAGCVRVRGLGGVLLAVAEHLHHAGQDRSTNNRNDHKNRAEYDLPP